MPFRIHISVNFLTKLLNLKYDLTNLGSKKPSAAAGSQEQLEIATSSDGQSSPIFKLDPPNNRNTNPDKYGYFLV